MTVETLRFSTRLMVPDPDKGLQEMSGFGASYPEVKQHRKVTSCKIHDVDIVQIYNHYNL
jgi:hypothetical protein